MKKLTSLLLIAALMISITACSGGVGTTTAAPETPAVTGSAETAAPTEAPTEPATEPQPAEEIALKGDTLKTSFVCEDNYRVFYEIFVGSFSDSDGDGIGDLRGIINRMDYLNDGDPNSGKSLGVEGLWLTPIFTSPSYHKYDVQDYYEVDPAFGTMEDLKELLNLCHERNVEVILDLVINHTGRRNKWFSDFVVARRQGDTASPYYDFYSTCSQNEAYPTGRVWEKVAGTDICYECNFSTDMPELNYDSENVRQAVLDVAKYYLDLGVDGFRFDAAKYVYLGDNAASASFWEWYMGELRKIKPDVYAVAEVWDADGITDIYYPAMDCFDFSVATAGGLLAETANHRDVSRLTDYVDSYLDNVTSMRDGAMIVQFLSNHDMDRAAGFLTEASGNMKVAANLYLLAPGSPYIYYGEELGMRGSRGGANTDANRRLAMLWGDGDTVKDPEGTTYKASSQVQATVADQIADVDSLYTYYKELIMLRKANPEIARGDYEPLDLGKTKAGGFAATWEGSTVYVIHNTTTDPITVDLDQVTGDALSISAFVGWNEADLNGTMLTIGGQTSVILK
ncbi:MAG: hypothetical protein J5865_08810 [Lachnospiraceae bacterium]|nr:hypothetical protein [Lachnospiraceae bacterium]